MAQNGEGYNYFAPKGARKKSIFKRSTPPPRILYENFLRKQNCAYMGVLKQYKNVLTWVCKMKMKMCGTRFFYKRNFI